VAIQRAAAAGLRNGSDSDLLQIAIRSPTLRLANRTPTGLGRRPAAARLRMPYIVVPLDSAGH